MALTSLAPNLLVNDMEKSLAFYRDVLGFQVTMSVPEQAPFVWAMLQSGEVSLMLQTRDSITEEYPMLKAQAGGGALTLYINTDDVRGLFERVKDRLTVVQGLKQTFYGATEFAVQDPDGFILTFAQHGG